MNIEDATVFEIDRFNVLQLEPSPVLTQSLWLIETVDPNNIFVVNYSYVASINKDMLLMVRYLQPTEHGIPLEIYCFSKDKEWINYEHIMADIFDHVMASLPYFKLEVFEIISTPGTQSDLN